MPSTYFRKRLIEALHSAEQAKDDRERSIHLRTSRYYRELYEAAARRLNAPL